MQMASNRARSRNKQKQLKDQKALHHDDPPHDYQTDWKLFKERLLKMDDSEVHEAR